jgi:hypothetical protein
MSYTELQKNSITNFRYAMFVNGVNAGVLANEDVTFNFNPAYEKIGSALSGVGAIAQINTGIDECTLTVTVQNYNKEFMRTCFNNILFSGSTPTNITTPFTGALEGRSNPHRQSGYEVVLYPFATDENGNVVANTETTAVKTAILMPEAVIASGLEMVFNPTTAFSYEIMFEGLADVVNDFRHFITDDGVDTDGSYAP